MLPSPRVLLLIFGLVALLFGALVWGLLRPPEWERAVPVSSVLPPRLLEKSGFPPADALTCKPCHPESFEDWKPSLHAHANRLVNPIKDGPAFNNARGYHEGLLNTEVSEKLNRLIVRQIGPDGIPSYHRAVAVIGVEPLVQYLAPFPRGRLQVINPAYDPKKRDWFDIYKSEPRQAYEWGFWKNQGMNWNSQCAYCHTTSFEKNYDSATDSYASAWKAMGISCSQCHNLQECRETSPKTPGRLAPQQAMAICASCHSRREELTAKFHPGETFDDHFRLTLPDLTDIYYPDGQVRDEDFEYASFLTSKMGRAGITCLDCHNPHSGKLKLPVENNSLCLSCHSPPGQRGAKPIPDAIAHGHHKPGSTGNLCVECHMPRTTYMARDPRRDHGFTIPDPQLTKELGIPNSCNRCHADQSTDWAIRWTQEWYGNKMDRPSRDRARLVARARAGDPAVTLPLIAFYKTEPNAAWRAALVSMLEGREQEPAVQDLLVGAAGDQSPLVRAAAIRTLGAAKPEILWKATTDPSRNVRIAASWQLLMNRQALPPDPRREIENYLANSSDQPGGAFFQARLAAVEKRFPEMERWIERAVSLDPSAGMFQQVAQLMYQANQLPKAKAYFDRSLAVEPTNVGTAYALALLEEELGNGARARELLRKTVSLAPGFGRAWYNLGLAEASQEDLSAAAAALQKAVALLPGDAAPSYALATIYLRMKDPARALEAAKKALSISPGHPEARRLLLQLLGPQGPGIFPPQNP
ncbi:MAG: tetratricopeptide repeat protein [Verrucomicrobiae bacterium]